MKHALLVVAAAAALGGYSQIAAADAKGDYDKVCKACHQRGVAGAPKTGDKAAWEPRIKTGMDALTASVINGKGVMMARGGSTLADAELRAVVEYIVGESK